MNSLSNNSQGDAAWYRRPPFVYLCLGVLVIALGLLGFYLATRKSEDLYIDGRIVSVRGNIIQMHPKWGGNLLRIVVDSKTPISIDGKPATLKSLRIGMAIGGNANKMSDDMMHPKELNCHEKPGAPGALFGTVLAIHGRSLTFRPRFTKDSLNVTVPPDASLIRQIALDPDSIKIGDKLTVWGGKSSRDVDTDLTAYVFLVGRQGYPRANPDSQSPDDQLLTGTVKALHPFTLAQSGGPAITITIPGEVPLSDMRPMQLKDIAPGSKVMLIGGTDIKGNIEAAVVIRDAPLVIGLGD